ncbi:MAG TPA: thymidine phosphorylase, partial [Spirochaetaceae bacterium]|nr:thymidine phosphorylase [Spirochaetaceae bacterium]
KKGDRIAIAYGKDEASLDPAMALARKAVSISKEAPQPLSLVIEEITAP